VIVFSQGLTVSNRMMQFTIIFSAYASFAVTGGVTHIRPRGQEASVYAACCQVAA
jgi:hypothetical protein